MYKYAWYVYVKYINEKETRLHACIWHMYMYTYVLYLYVRTGSCVCIPSVYCTLHYLCKYSYVEWLRTLHVYVHYYKDKTAEGVLLLVGPPLSLINFFFNNNKRIQFLPIRKISYTPYVCIICSNYSESPRFINIHSIIRSAERLCMTWIYHTYIYTNRRIPLVTHSLSILRPIRSRFMQWVFRGVISRERQTRRGRDVSNYGYHIIHTLLYIFSLDQKKVQALRTLQLTYDVCIKARFCWQNILGGEVGVSS